MIKDVQTVGRVENVSFTKLMSDEVPARIDTGAKTSAIWASNIVEEDGQLSCMLFGPDSTYYTGDTLQFDDYEVRSIASSNGIVEDRYVVKLTVSLKTRKIVASFTLANRSQQAYPVLIGRNVLRGKFIVDVKQGIQLTKAERMRSQALQAKSRKERA